MNINVTKPFLPPLEEYQAYIKEIWKRTWLTNHGPLVNELELKLKEYLGIEHILFLNNGTIALMLAIKALDLKQEVITTPFSYVATTTSIQWQNCTPVFADIDPLTLNIDPKKIEEAITEKTSGILATHVFGNPCDIDAIQQIADKYKLKVIYDAAHCFGTSYKGQSVLKYGDVSAISFHGTKVFHTGEGGAVITKDPDLLKKISLLRNFGHTSPSTFDGIGINGKNSELHAALGICNLKYMNEVLLKREKQSNYYNVILSGLEVKRPQITPGSTYNHAYYPVIFKSEEKLLKAIEILNGNYVFPRRYFYPSLSTINNPSLGSCPVSEDIASRILCLPLYHDLSKEEQDMIARLLLRAQNYG